MLPDLSDTITALATPPGEGGIAVVRLSGPDCISIAQNVTKDRIDECASNPRMMQFLNLVDYRDEPLDDALVVFFKGPKTYTGEDSIEFHCHGGEFLSHKLVESLVHFGARRAEPGEFTMRAFLNGRIDLTEAEGILSLITCSASVSHSRAINLLRGGLKEKVEKLRDEIIELIAPFEALIDHPEDDISDSYSSIDLDKLSEIKNKIDDLASGYIETKDLDSGLKIAIIGKPNVGKSSLMNRILMKHRVLVHHSPGTTRDVISEDIIIGEGRFKIYDTAGLRKNADEIEQAGIELTKEALESADVALVVFDLSTPLTDEDFRIVEDISHQSCTICLNKSDLEQVWRITDYPKIFSDRKSIHVSAKTGVGIEELLDELRQIYIENSSQIKSTTPVLKRHYGHLVKASESLEKAQEAVSRKLASDAVAIDLRAALEEILRITGESYDDALLEEIFSSFCIGK
jgi:tRNA modification GTPase